MIHKLAGCFILFLLFSNRIQADNGALAYAYPMKHVQIDGDLSDWPQQLAQYPIQIIRTRGTKPNSSNDFEAYFKVGYNLQNNSIYIAVVVTDDSHIIDRSISPAWDQQDKHLLYIDPTHSKRGSCPISYSATQIKREIGGSEFGWDPQTSRATWDNIELQISRQSNTTIYEYRVELESLSANSVIGLDHVLYDKDEDDTGKGRSYIMWGPHAGKSGAPKRSGDLMLLEQGQALSKVSGKVLYKNQKELKNKLIRISSKDHPKFWISTPVDSSGQYETKLPFGNYYLDFPDAFMDNGETETRINQSIKYNFTASKNNLVNPLFQIEPLQKPKLNQTKGILHHFSLKDTLLIDDYMQKMMHYYAIPGASLGIIKNGKLVYNQTYGVKNALTQESVVANSIFQAASITKPVFAYTVLKLAERGIIDLDKPLYQYLPFKALEGDERYKKMTARHVLSHQTGLPNWGRKLTFEPGTKYGYSGEGFEYLKRVVEKITKRNILDILDEEVLIPLDMTKNTYFVREAEMYGKAVLGHHHDLPTTNWIISRVGMARSMYTEANEFSKFVIALINGKGLKKETHQNMFSSQVSIPLNEENPVADWQRSFGLGMLIKDSPYGKCYGHGGSNQYFQSLFEFYKDQEMGFIIFTNNDMGYYLGNDLREFLIIGE